MALGEDVLIAGGRRSAEVQADTPVAVLAGCSAWPTPPQMGVPRLSCRG